MKINCIVIDDEQLALDLVDSYIKKIPYLQLKGLYYNPTEALDVLKTERIDLIYLDIQMPEMGGIEFLRSLSNPPKIIFITAYDQFAIKGFELNAVDYLLKPVPLNRFLLASDRALSLLKGDKSQVEDYIFVKAAYDTIKVALKSIHYIEGYKDYLKIYTDDSSPILTITTFKAMEELLPSYFLRVHRSYIVSINKIVSIRNSKVLVKGKNIPIGESYADSFHRLVVEGRS